MFFSSCDAHRQLCCDHSPSKCTWSIQFGSGILVPSIATHYFVIGVGSFFLKVRLGQFVGSPSFLLLDHATSATISAPWFLSCKCLCVMTHYNDICLILYSARVQMSICTKKAKVPGTIHGWHTSNSLFFPKVGLAPKIIVVIPKGIVMPSGPNMESERDQDKRQYKSLCPLRSTHRNHPLYKYA